MPGRTLVLTLVAVVGASFLSAPASLQTIKCTDENGVLMISETFGGRVQRFSPRSGVDQNLLVRAPLPPMRKAGI